MDGFYVVFKLAALNIKQKTEISRFLTCRAWTPLVECRMSPDFTLAPSLFQPSRRDWGWAMKGEEEVIKWSQCFFLRAVIRHVVGAPSSWEAGSVFSPSAMVLLRVYLNLERVKERWRERLPGAYGTTHREYRGYCRTMSLSPLLISHSLSVWSRIIALTQLKQRGEKPNPLQPSSLLITPSSLSLLCLSPSLSNHPTRGGMLAFKKANL